MHIRFLLLVVLAYAGYIVHSNAAGFYIQEQSVSGLGTAFAGSVADTPDASTIYYNPAGMTELDGPQVSIGTHLIIPNTTFKNEGSTVSSTVGTAGAPTSLSGTNGRNPYDPAVIPNAYLAFPVTEDRRLWAGIGISAPFGLTNEYDDDYFGRYDSTENQLITVDVAPSLALALRKWISVGAGINIQSVEAKLESAVPSPITPGGPTPATDGLQDLSGDDLTIGFNAGLLIKPVEGTRIGAHIRQGISHTLKGRVITRIPSDVPGLGGTFTRAGVQAELDLPNIITAGFSQDITDRFKILGHVVWFEWSNFDDIPILTDTGTFTTDTQNYKNTFGFALGAHYKVNNKLTLKAGVQYDESPTQDGFRTTRIPDGDRRWIAAGASYQLNDAWALDIAAAYVDVKEEAINLSDTVPIGAASTTFNVNGKTEGDVGIVSAALRYKFDMPE